MIRLIIFLVVATAAAIGAVWFANHPGVVLFEWQGRRIETSVGILLLAVAVVAVAFAVLVEIVRVIVGAPRRFRARRRSSRELRGYRELSRGLISAAAGDVRASRLHGRQAERLIGHEPGVKLLTAQVAQLEGDDDRALLAYRSMLSQQETEFLALRSLLGQALKIGDREEALALARRAYRENAEAPWTASTLFDLLTKQASWVEALEVVNNLEASSTIDRATASRHRATLEYLVSRDKRAADQIDAAIEASRRSLRLMPTFTPAATLLAAGLVERGQTTKARRTLERAWKIRPHPDLANAYADLVPGEGAIERYKRFDRLRRRHPAHVETGLMLAHWALAAGAPDAARSHLQPLLEHQPTARTCRAMAEVERASGASQDVVHTWLSRALEAQPDPTWVCEDTGDTLPAWQPFGTSGRFDVVTWSIPPTLTPLVRDARSDYLSLRQEPELQPAGTETGPGPAREAGGAPGGSVEVAEGREPGPARRPDEAEASSRVPAA